MNNLNLELVDIVLPLIAILFIGYISLMTLSYKQQKALRLQRDGLKVPGHMRRMLHLSATELRVDMIGRCVAFFVLIMAMQIIKAFKFSLAFRLALSLLIAAVLLLIIPWIFVKSYQWVCSSRKLN